MSSHLPRPQLLFPVLTLVKATHRWGASLNCLGLLLVAGAPSRPSPSPIQTSLGTEASSATSDSGRSGTSLVDGAHPDVALEMLDDEGQVTQAVGEGVLTDEALQTLPCPIMAGTTQTLLVHVKNTGSQMGAFSLHLEGLPLAAGKARPWPSRPWSVRIIVDGETTDLLAPLQSPAGWQSPKLASGAEVVLRIALTAPTQVDGQTLWSSFRFLARYSKRVDAVVAQVGAQAIAKLRWNAEGDPEVETNWHDVTKDTRIEVEQFTVLGVRAVKANPAIDWPSPTGLGPVWTWQGKEVHGETVFLHADKVTGDIPNVATATCGNSQSVSVRVFAGDALLTFDKEDTQ